MSGSAETVLLAGASRGLGLGLARAYAARGARVIATARDPNAAELRALADASEGRVTVEQLDITTPADAERLAARLPAGGLDLLFVVAGQGAGLGRPIEEIPSEVAAQEFLTNAHGPVVLAERLHGAVKPEGVVAFMTSILGSLASSNGGMDLYRASKAALNMLALGYAKRHAEKPVVLMHPGWVRTAMGGESAPVGIDESVAGMVRVLDGRRGKRGIAYLDYQGQTIPW